MTVDEKNQSSGVGENRPAPRGIRDVDVPPDIDGMAGQVPPEILDDDATYLVVGVDIDTDALIDGDLLVAVSALSR